MRSVYVAAAAGILLAGCSLIGNDRSFVGEDSTESSSLATTHAENTDDTGDSAVSAMRQSAWHPVKIRGDGTTGNMTSFCKAVAISDADSSSYDPATSRRVEAMRLAQCRALTEP